MPTSKTSLFVTIEGVEGGGKSTLRTHLSELLRKSTEMKGHDLDGAVIDREVLVTREPGATPIGTAIRNLLLDPRSSVTSLTELMLFSADRAQHLEEVVRPALQRGAIVLCDRFIHSTIAYQGYGRGLALEQLWQLNNLVTGGLRPDLVLLLDLPVEEGLRRARSRAALASGRYPTLHSATEQVTAGATGSTATDDGWSRFEEQEIAFHQRVRDGFLTLAKDPTHRIEVLNAVEDSERVAALAYSAILRAFERANDNGHQA